LAFDSMRASSSQMGEVIDLSEHVKAQPIFPPPHFILNPTTLDFLTFLRKQKLFSARQNSTHERKLHVYNVSVSKALMESLDL